MRCSLPRHVKVDELPWKEGLYSQVKMNGTFLRVSLGGDTVITTRKGMYYPVEEFRQLTTLMRLILPEGKTYHGEVLVRREGALLDRATSNGILSSIRQGNPFSKNEYPCYYIWDFEDDSMPYEERWKVLRNIKSLYVTAVDCKEVYSLKEALKHSANLIEEGYEGTVIKRKDMMYKNGTSKGQIKLKKIQDCNLRIIGFKQGKEGSKYENTLGSLYCATEEGDLGVFVSGFTDAERDEIWANSPDWLYTIVEVKYQELTKNTSTGRYSLDSPIYVRQRDTDEADTLEYLLAK
jgi:DNA ligase-1